MAYMYEGVSKIIKVYGNTLNPHVGYYREHYLWFFNAKHTYANKGNIFLI